MFVEFFIPAWLAAQEVVRDDFAAYRHGSRAAPQWQAAKGFWLAEHGHFCERSGAFDAGAFRPEFVSGSFEISVRFRVLSAYNGAGLFFASENAGSAAFAHMVRLDGTNALLGFFERGNYQATQVAPLPTAVADSGWHTMRLQVLQKESVYRFWVDGEPVGKPEKLHFRSGFVGLQNSGGHACFDDFLLTTLPDTTAASPVSWPVSLAPAENGSIWVGSPSERAVKKLDREGKVLATIAANAPAEAFAPVALANLPEGGIAVLDSTGRRVHRYDAAGAYRQTIGGWQQPADVAALADGRVLVSDIGAGKLLAYDEKWASPKTVVETRATLLAANEALLGYFSEKTARFHFLQITDFAEIAAFDAPAGQLRGLAMSATALFVAVDARIDKYALSGERLASLSLEMMGGLFPQKIAIDGQNVLIADFTGNRIIIADTSLTAPILQPHFAENGRLALRWAGAQNDKTALQLVGGDTTLLAENVRWQNGHFEAQFNAVPPSTFFRANYKPVLPTVPPAEGSSGSAALVTPPPVGKTQFAELNCAAVLFANVIDSAKVQPGWPAMPLLSNAEIKRIRAQIEDGRRFFWLNSGMRLHLDMRTIVVDSLFERKSLFGDEWYYPPNEPLLEQILRENGVQPTDLQSVFFIAAIRDFDEATQQWPLRGRGGAFTNGLSANGQYGLSWWEATRAGHDAGNNWLVVHEFHHQLDELFTLNGMPEYWFNHFAPIAGTAAKFGEHFDGNAWILRNWPYEKWFALSQANLRLADDTDGDGIPDWDARLPMDEQRLGSDPAKKDSDGDGVADLAEIAFSNWVAEGHGERAGAHFSWPNLSSADSDSDGVPDSDDRHPLLPWSGEIGEVQHGFSLIGELGQQNWDARAEAAWSADSLLFRFRVGQNRRLRLLVDANNNGWFCGRDNLVFLLDTSDSLAGSVEVFQAAAPDKWPYLDEALAQKVRYSWRQVAPGVFQLAIAKNEEFGLWLEHGEQIGVDVSISGANGAKRISFHEPNRFFELILK